MKKSVSILTSIGLVLMLIGGALFYTFPMMFPNATFYTLEGITWDVLVSTWKGLFDFSSLVLPQILILALGGLGVLIFLASFIVCIAKKRPSGLFPSLFLLLDTVIAIVGFTLLLHPHVAEPFTVVNGSYHASSQWGWFDLCAQFFQSAAGNVPVLLISLFAYFIVLLVGVGYVMGIIGAFEDMVTGKSKAKKKAAAQAGKADLLPSEKDDVVVVHDDEVIPPASEEEIAAALGVAAVPNGKNATGTDAAAAAAGPAYATAQGIQGPLLVQYINTYSPAQQETNARGKNGQVPLSEIQGAITGEKPLSAEDIRKIVREEMAPKEEEKQPIVISVPSPTKAETPALTAEDVRRILAEELSKTLTPDEGDVLVEETPVPALTAEEVRAIIAEELAASKKVEEPEPEPEPEPEKPLCEEDVRNVVATEIRSFYAEKEAAEKAPEPEPVKEEKEPALTALEIRQIINEELARREPTEPKNELTPDLIREIIRQEMIVVPPLKEEKVEPVTVVVKAPAEEKTVEESKKEEPVVEVKKEEPAPAPATNPTITVVVHTNAPAEVKKEEPAPEPVPDEPKARVVGAVNPDLPPHEKIVRIPFQTRMADADKEMKDNYNDLKSEIMSYGVKSRISNKGDTFRLHKVTFVRITIAGKSLKLYFALDPKDYENSPIPVQDAGHKGVYKDIPLVFKVKSELSVRRAKELIANVMEKNGLEQGKVEPRDWVAEIPPAKDGDDSED